MMRFPLGRPLLGLFLLVLAGCAPPAAVVSPAGAAVVQAGATPLDGARQMVLVVTPGWDSTAGTLRRYVRDSDASAWRAVGADVPIVVGRAGVAWDD